MSLVDKRVMVTGGNGFLGREVAREFRSRGAQVFAANGKKSCGWDLTDQHQTQRLFNYADRGTDVLVHCAALAGGIGLNQARPADLFRDNMLMSLNVLDEARIRGVKKVVMIGSVCAFPEAPKHIPFEVSDLWSGYPEPTNAAYGVAKRALITAADAYRQQYGLNVITVVPTNLYGPGDNFDEATSHVIPALIRKFVAAAATNESSVTLWGTGEVSRDFLYVKDCATAIALAAELYDSPTPLLLGSGAEVFIDEVADTVADLCGFKGEILWDRSRPDGQQFRAVNHVDAERALCWRAKTPLYAGLAETIAWYKTNQ